MSRSSTRETTTKRKRHRSAGAAVVGRASVRAQLREARKHLRVWFYEMATDYQDGEYDCTCSPDDPCPLHRVAKFLGVPKSWICEPEPTP